MKCPICRTDARANATTCRRCGTRLVVEDLPPELAREDAERRRVVQRDIAARHASHVMRTTIIGAIVFTVLGASLSGIRLFNSVRRDLGHIAGTSDERADAASLKTGLFLASPVAAALGAAAGYLIGRRELHMKGGALVGAALFAFGSILLNSPVIANSRAPLWELFIAAVLGLPAGAMLGLLLGYHAKSDTE